VSEMVSDLAEQLEMIADQAATKADSLRRIEQRINSENFNHELAEPAAVTSCSRPIRRQGLLPDPNQAQSTRAS